MARASNVWMIHATTGLNGIRGTISLEGQDLVFRPESGREGETVFRVSEIKKVHRVKGSPILEIFPTSASQPSVVGFYFVKPPSLQDDEPTTLNFLHRRTGRKKALNALRTANAFKKDEIDRWVRAIRAARPG
jgi:hypothetical protein